MGDLEEFIFKRNIPGRYSRWDEERDDQHTSGYSDIEEEQEEIVPTPGNLGESEDIVNKVLNAEIPDSIRDGILNDRMGKHSTGVKGVLADYKANKALKQAERDAKEQQRKDILRRMVEGAKVVQTGETVSAINNELDEDDDDDDEFLAEYRKKRLQELKLVSNLPTFGQVREITESDFTDEVEKVDPRTVVIVHLYDTTISGCVRMNHLLEEIAHKLKTIKFLRMNVSSCGIEVDRVALPILNIYKGGETIDVIAGITIEYGEFFKKEEIQRLIEIHTSKL